ncbi:hypothetical protein CEP52_017545 [Fusarium oligoseptatum]|uniref:Uncharacterized protein n=1 Tax=Fusarium oligoseptatum TaxID=2604345 RepID=A0A428RNX6_9HYPO|nr:hypothetical protein CEP52_017545 [Fusarium oligoseptatum]
MMNPENSIWTGNTLEQDVLATHSGSGDPALEVGNPSHPTPGSYSYSPPSVLHKSKNHDPRVLSAAVESIARLGEMEEYDEAAGTIHDVLSGFWANWLNSIKHSLSCRMPVLDLFSNDEIAEFIYPRLPCHSPNGRLLSTGTATSAVLEHTHLVQETVVTALEPIVTAEDKDGIEREFDLRNLQRALVYVEDTSGQGRYIQAPTLADLLSNYGAGMQFQSLYTVSPAITMPSEATFPLDTFATQEALWPS